MRAGPVLTAALLLALVPLSVHAKLPAAYPRALEILAEGLLDGAEDDVWPAGRGIHPDAERFLDDARDALGAGRVAQALDLYLVFRVENAVQHTLDDLEHLGATQARTHLRNATSHLAADGRDLAVAARATINDLDVEELTITGGEAGVLGALHVARGELQLNLFEQVRARALSETGTADENVTGAMLQASLGGATEIALGTSIASLAGEVAGERLAPGELAERIEDVARTRVTASGPREILDNFPRGNATTDGPVLRAGLLLVAAEELRSIEVRKTYLSAEGVDLVPHIMEGLAFDRDNLRAYAHLGSPLALAAYESTDLDAETVGEAALEQVTKVRGFAQSTFAAERIIRPAVEPMEEADAPLPSVALLLLVLCAAAARRRTR